MSGLWRLLRALKVRVTGPPKELVGLDHYGNKYYLIPKHETWAGQTIRERRMVDAGNLKEYQYEAGIIPTEWEAWIRKKRKDPPTIEEILKNENYREEIKLKAKEAYEKDRLLQAKDGLVAEPVQTQIKGHASAHYYGKNEPSPDPTSTASTFQPGSWTPNERI
uniref:NADH:ubiquinone oxidoreductase complex assembly factor 2 n=1 Tax=Sphenodon punctatus TaxID=8508 RepID=A0A8D0G7Z9_SPHPU